MSIPPTPYPAVNAMLQEVLKGARRVLGERFVGMYLDGSLANGGFDEGSDIDFVVVTTEDIAGDLFLDLQTMHDAISRIDSPWAIQLEGSYISRHAVRRYDPLHVLHPNLERGQGERLKMAVHDPVWAIHRWVLCEKGITITGPAPAALIDPVSKEELRGAARHALQDWAASLAEHPEGMNSRGYQSYVVLTLCRILYTLSVGEVASKPAALRWAVGALSERRRALIERAWVDRLHADGSPEPEDVRQTVEMIREALESSSRL